MIRKSKFMMQIIHLYQNILQNKLDLKQYSPGSSFRLPGTGGSWKKLPTAITWIPPKSMYLLAIFLQMNSNYSNNFTESLEISSIIRVSGFYIVLYTWCSFFFQLIKQSVICVSAIANSWPRMNRFPIDIKRCDACSRSYLHRFSTFLKLFSYFFYQIAFTCTTLS